MAAAVQQDFIKEWNYESHQAAIQRDREHRWSRTALSKVVHPKYGSVVVPHASNYSAILNAAEYWGCDWVEIIHDAQVWLAKPEDGPAVAMPEIYRNEGNQWKIGASAAVL